MSSPADQQCLNAALRLLAYRSRSDAELRRRLSRRFSNRQVQDTLVHLRQQGLVDDQAFARFWRESRERHRPRGVAMIRRELLHLGVEREVVAEALDGMDEEEGAYKAAIKAVNRVGQVDYESFRKRVGGYLYRRGFSPAAIKETMRRVWEELAHPVDGYEHSDSQDQQS